MKHIIVNVSGLSVEEKQRVNEALAKITGVRKIPLINNSAGWFFAPATSNEDIVSWDRPSPHETPTHTPQQVLEMAGMAKQGHVHADLMALYAEDAKTTDKPWELWQVKDKDGVWWECKNNPLWGGDTEYRRKPKTHIIHGVEVPDLLVSERDFGMVYSPAPLNLLLYVEMRYAGVNEETRKRGLFYEYTESGKQAAILHAKAWLGIA